MKESASSSSSGDSSSSNSEDTASSSSQEVTNEPGDAIEPSEEFPAPPQEFLEDIKAFRKQEEIEGPLNHPHPAALNAFDAMTNNISRSFNGNGSLNSSITETETTESSWSPSASPISSPLPSPCPSSSSVQSFSLPEGRSSHEQRFIFPSGHSLSSARNSLRLPHSQAHFATGHPRLQQMPHASLIDASLRNRMTTAVRGVTLAPLHPSSLERDPIYQRLPPTSHSYGCLPRMPSSPSALSSSSSASTSSSSLSALRPPDYMTAMQRLTLTKVSTSKFSQGPLLSSSSSASQSIPQHHRSASQPLKSIPSLSSSLPDKRTLSGINESANSSSLPVRLRRSSISSSCSEDPRTQSAQSNSSPSRSPSKASLKMKKRVSFSDQVELVAHSEDREEEEHLPNPLLERVLGKAFLQNNNIRNG